MGSIFVDNEKANKSISATDKKVEGLGSKLVSGIGTAAKWGAGIAAGAAAATGAVVVLAAKTVESYADYEQLVGGVETLFGDSADIVKKYADSAYKTAGMTANKYMETVTSFSASLLQGLNGDTAKAAEVADMAITDMSDNANKMGTSIESIQNAYQGFAKQNYTMLDNLKLGYGGTKEEMKRLLADAEKLSGKKYDLSNLNDVYEAIHVVQTEMGITGTTAKEAESTISGSIGMIKAKLQNFVTKIGASIAPVVQNFLTYVIDSLPKLESMVDEIIPVIGDLMSTIIPPAMNFIQNIVPALVEVFKNVMPFAVEILKQVGSAFSVVFKTIEEFLPIVLDYLGQFVSALQEFWYQHGEVIMVAIKDAFSLLWDTLVLVWDTVGKPLFDAIVEIFKYVSDNFNTISGTISDLFSWLMGVLSTVWSTVGKPVFDLIMSVVSLVADYFKDKMPLIQNAFSEAVSVIKNAWENGLKPVFEVIGYLISNVLAPTFEWVFENIIAPAVDRCFGRISELWNKVLKPIFEGIIDFVGGVFSGQWSRAWHGILDILKGIFNGMVQAVKTPLNQVIGIINGFIGAVNKIDIPDWVPGVGGKGINIPKIPMLAKGGTVFEQGHAIVGEAGAELIELPRGARVTPLTNNGNPLNDYSGMLEKIYGLLDNLLSATQRQDMQVVLDTGILVGQLAPGVDRKMSANYRLRERGV